MKANGIGSVLIVDGEHVCGIFTERDLLTRVLARQLDPATTLMARVMTRNPDCLHPHDTIAFALHKMSHGHFRHIPLVDEAHRPVGIVSVKDVFWHLVRSVPKYPTEELMAARAEELMRWQLPGLDEFGLDHGREAETDKVLSEAAVHVPISQLDLLPPVSVEGNATVAQAIQRMAECGTGSLLVLKAGELVGILTERDLLMRVAGTRLDLSRTTVADLATECPDAMSPDDLIIDAMAFMEEGGYRRVPVVDKSGRPIGIFSINRVVDRLVEYFPEEILNLPPRLERRMRSREGA
jgi:CBS domain-containing protein